ncbi:hypothetical protein JDV02_000246 [Purpureocillium takamizusanense]|uniref:Major facilitator superfamily (MFS) profile domain-containing protein n=1 Tax=Purpureocillium takamizusanense TaxID=2060973 RepID=A0A9Q8V6N3_9HYPO|nr:uncharacterized protein JDV02_000246 [Purpureocillium takamizusanense]UNI13506.1 hypothetical protein JDV02_000246 [Purpureocillium takamizusanense]
MSQTAPLLADVEDEPRSYVREPNGQEDVKPVVVHGSPDDAQEWPPSVKWSMVALVSLSAFSVTYGCLSVAPVATRIANDLDGGDSGKSAAALLVTIWELGEAAGPLLIAPLAEMFGRRPLYNVANLLFVAATMLGALSRDKGEFVASRALTGMAVAANVLNPAIIGDMFPTEQRGAAMSCIMFAPLVASSVGPVFSSILADRMGWRSVPWTSAALAALCVLAFSTCFRETYRASILRRKITWIRKESEDEHSSHIDSLTREITVVGSPTGIWSSMMRPITVFLDSGVLASLSLFGSLMFSYFYVISTTLPDILEEVYQFPSSMTGSAFLANGVGSLIGVVICNLTLDRIYIKLSNDNNKGVGLPEFRLPLTLIGVATMTPAVALYGWCAEYRLPLYLFVVSVVWIRVSMTVAFVPLMPYVVDACGTYSASALTGTIVIRCLAGTFCPLLTAEMIERMGYGWAFTTLAVVSLVVGIIPAMIFRYGSRWRQRSKYTKTTEGA